MNTKQEKILQTIFSDPIQPTLKWSDIENLMLALGAKVEEGSGKGKDQTNTRLSAKSGGKRCGIIKDLSGNLRLTKMKK